MSHKNMKEELTCPICMELFRLPRRLPCGHSYCYVCLKAMLDRCTEFSGLYLDYSRSLVCPECREEMNIESDRGVEMIPPDFKLSKLVDLFKFMKKNDSSDSSCDEQQSCQPAVTADSASTPAAAGDMNSLPATSPSTGSSSSQTSHLSAVATSAGQPPQPLQLPPPSAGTNTTNTAVSTDSHLQSRNTHAESSSGVTALSSAVSSHPSATGISSTASPADTHSREITDPNNTRHVHRDSSLSYLHPETVICNTVSNVPGFSPSHASAVENQPRPAHASVASERSQSVFRNSSVIHVRNPSVEFSSVSGHGTDGGGEVNGDYVDGLSVRPEQHVDSLEILSNWVNENHCYSQGSRNLSHSAVSLPAEVVLEEAESYHEHSPELVCNVARGTRAQSVPTETGEWNRAAQPGGSGERAASKSLHNVKARRVQRGVFGRFVDSDTSSDSSNNNGRENQRSTGKPKRWLMTRFLRSVILSDSSSTDYSDDDGEVERNARSSKGERTTIHSQQSDSSATSHQSHPQSVAASSQGGNRQRISGSSQHAGSNRDHQVTMGCRSTDITQSQGASQQHNLTTSAKTRNTDSEMPETALGSIDSRTSAKELVRDGEAALSSGDTLPKAAHEWKSTRESQQLVHVPFSATASYGQDSHLSEHRSQSLDSATDIPQRLTSSSGRQRGQQTFRTNLPCARSPPTFYDNLGAFSDGDEGRTLYDNVGSGRASRGAEGLQSCHARDLRFDPCIQQQLTSEHGQARTLYDNIDGHHIRPEHTSTKSDHKHLHNRNAVTDIDDLKTGYEHFHMENVNNIGADSRESDARLPPESSHVQHMGELDDNTRCPPVYPQAGQHATEPGYNFNPNNSSHAQKHPGHTRHLLVDGGDHHSFYDNMNHTLGNPQGGAVLHKKVNHNEDRNARFAHREGKSGACHANVLNKQGRIGDDELQHMDNYLDHYSEHFRNASSAKNAGTAVGRRRHQAGGVGDTASAEGTLSPTGGDGGQATGATSSESRKTQGCNTQHADVASEVDSENGSNSAMLQEKKKPRSRLKKFLTSLLSLSSSSSSSDDDVEHHGETSSESSAW
ncbi:hypothetical protein BsWGS_14336 [Bradybaena similaris]